ncbi:MAG: ATP-dependent sacrificial sulfur transferase LarE [Nitrososphaerales archaeon]
MTHEHKVKQLKELSEITSELNPELKSKAEALYKWFKEKKSVIVALSGGVDSSVVAAFAKLALNNRATAVTCISPTLAPLELEDAKKVASFIGIRHILLNYSEEANQKVADNPPERCYYCRSELANLLKQIRKEDNEATMVDGGVLDDLNQRRPGVRALRENGVRSPLQEVGLTKQEVRQIAKAAGLPNHDKPSNACLASRFPYGQRITAVEAQKVAEAEALIKKMTNAKQVRVRVHGDLARIEVGKDERKLFFDEVLMDKIYSSLKTLGYTFVTLDLFGYRSGSLDEAL